MEVTSANQKLGAENKKLIEQIKQLSAQLDKQKKKNRKQKKIIKELSNTEKDDKGNEVVEVFDIMDDGNSPVPSPVILPPEFFNYYSSTLSSFAIDFIAYLYRPLQLIL